jgi:hypothetical protein
MNEDGLRKSKNVIIRMVNKMFQDLRLNDFDVEFIGTQKISNARFNTVQMNPDDVNIYVRGDHIFLDILKMGGKLSCHSWKKVLWTESAFDLEVSVNDHGSRMEADLTLETRNFDGIDRIIPQIRNSMLKIYSSEVDINVISRDLGMAIAGRILGAPLFRSAFIDILEPVLNGGPFENVAN